MVAKTETWSVSSVRFVDVTWCLPSAESLVHPLPTLRRILLSRTWQLEYGTMNARNMIFDASMRSRGLASEWLY